MIFLVTHALIKPRFFKAVDIEHVQYLFFNPESWSDKGLMEQIKNEAIIEPLTLDMLEEIAPNEFYLENEDETIWRSNEQDILDNK